jgi:hypothetical protein
MIRKSVLILLAVLVLLMAVVPADTVQACQGKGCQDSPTHRRCRTRGMARLNNPHCTVDLWTLVLEVLGVW